MYVHNNNSYIREHRILHSCHTRARRKWVCVFAEVNDAWVVAHTRKDISCVCWCLLSRAHCVRAATGLVYPCSLATYGTHECETPPTPALLLLTFGFCFLTFLYFYFFILIFILYFLPYFTFASLCFPLLQYNVQSLLYRHFIAPTICHIIYFFKCFLNF